MQIAGLTFYHDSMEQIEISPLEAYQKWADFDQLKIFSGSSAPTEASSDDFGSLAAVHGHVRQSHSYCVAVPDYHVQSSCKNSAVVAFCSLAFHSVEAMAEVVWISQSFRPSPKCG